MCAYKLLTARWRAPVMLRFPLLCAGASAIVLVRILVRVNQFGQGAG